MECQWCKSILSDYGFCPKCEKEEYYDERKATCCWCHKTVRIVEQSDYEIQHCYFCKIFICDDCMWGDDPPGLNENEYIRIDENYAWCPNCCKQELKIDE